MPRRSKSDNVQIIIRGRRRRGCMYWALMALALFAITCLCTAALAFIG